MICTIIGDAVTHPVDMEISPFLNVEKTSMKSVFVLPLPRGT